MSDEPVTRRDVQLLSEIIRRRNDDDYRGVRSNLVRGGEESTEYYAWPYVYPALPSDAPQRQRLVLLRSVALAADFSTIPQFQKSETTPFRTFGAWCYVLSAKLAQARGGSGFADPKDPDVVAERLAYLHTQDLEEAFRTVRRIMSIAASLSAPPAIDYFDLYRMFSRWGNGFSERSRRARMRPLREYYGAFGGYGPVEQPATTHSI